LKEKVIIETDYLIGMIKEEFNSNLKEGLGAQILFDSLKTVLRKIYLRPNNVIDTSLHSERKIESALNKIGFQFKQEIDDKLHFFNPETSVSVYLNPRNRRLYLMP